MEINRQIIRYCFWLLSKRDYSVFEIESKLKNKQYTPEQIKTAIDYLLDKKFLDDRKYAQRYFENHRSRGKIRIKFELIKKGVNADLIEEIVSRSDSEAQIDQAREVAKAWWQRKYKPDIDQYKLKQQLMQKLARQGFEYGVIREVAEGIIKNDQ